MKNERKSQNTLFLYCIYKKYNLGLGDDLGLLLFDRTIDVDTLLFFKSKSCINSFTISAQVKGGELAEYDEENLQKLPLASDLHYYEEIDINYYVNYDVTKIELQEHIHDWQIGNIQQHGYENIIKPHAQILKVLELIKRYKEDFINKEQLSFSSDDFDNQIDLLETLIFLESEFIISLDQIYFHSSRSGNKNGRIDYHISVNKNTFKKWYNHYKNKISHRIVLDEDTGIVSLEGRELGKIKVHTQPYMFFKYLYDNLGISKSHEDIHQHIFQGARTEKPINLDLSDMKKSLPNEIKGLIESQTGHYIIP